MHLAYKHLYIVALIALLLSGIVLSGATTVKATNDMDELCEMYKMDGASLTEEIFENIGINIDLDFKKVFGGTRKKPKVENLYMSLYSQVRTVPDDEAMKKTAESNQLTEGELCSIFGGNYQLLSTIYDQTFTISDLTNEVQRLKEEFERNLAEEQKNQKMFLDTYGKEVFVNGDESDSGFDVLYDLALIEYVLFGEESSIGSGGPLGLEPSDNYADGGGFIGPLVDAIDDLTADEEESETTATADEDEEEEDAAADSEEEEAVNPAECIADTGLQDAFADAGIVASSTITEEDAETGEDEDEEDSGNGDGDGSGDDEDDQADTNDEIEIEEGDWEWREPPCNDVFCLTIEFKNTDEPSFSVSSNCVKCHVDYIVEELDKLTTQNLNPGKLSGNLLEPSMCKKTLMAAGINLSFIPIAMPIQTPPADDIISRNNFMENFVDFVKDTWPLAESKKFEEDSGAADPATKTNTTVRRELLDNAISYQQGASDTSVTTEELFTEAMIIYEEQVAEMEDKFSTRNIIARTAAVKNLYQDLKIEMDQMVQFFNSYQNLIGQTLEIAVKITEKNKAS